MSETIVVYVDSGETLSEIAARYGVTVEQLQQWNRIEDPNFVQVGQRIVVHEAVVPPGWDEPAGAWGPWMGAALVVALLWFLFRRRRKPPTSAPDARVASPTKASHEHEPRPAAVPGAPEPRPAAVSRARAPRPAAVSGARAPKENAGERLVRSVLTRRYPDWPLLNDVLLPSGEGTAQIDHILASPSGVFLIETKDMNGWLFGSPGQRWWTQSFKAGRWSRLAGIRSKRFTFYNPLLQNEGHAKALVKLGAVYAREIRPVAVFVGEAELKTAEKFAPIEEHEERANRFNSWRMRGVVCMSLAELHQYIAFSVRAPSGPSLTRERMEAIRARIEAAALPVTVETRARHVEFARSAQRASGR